MEKSVVWFSHEENKYDAELKLFQKKYFYWTDKSPTWDWDNCAVTWIKKSEQEIHVVIRSSKFVSSRYRRRTVKVKYMLGFDVRTEDIQYPINDNYRQPDNKKKKDGSVKPRWAFKLNKHYCIWQWAEENKNGLENSEVYRIYSEIKKTLTEPITIKRSIFRVPGVPADNRLIPVIYQGSYRFLEKFCSRGSLS